MNAKHLFICTVLAAGLMAVRTLAQDATPATQPAGTVVNVHLKSALAEDVFGELAKQGGVRFSTNGNLWEQDSMQSGIDVDLTNRPFWSAVLEMCDMWNLSIQPNYGNNTGRRVMLQQMGGRRARQAKPPTVESDGFVVQAISFNRQQSVNYLMPNNNQNFCTVEMNVYIDPALHLSSFDQNPAPTEAVDDAGHSMMPDPNNRTFYGGGSQSSLIYNCHVPLKYPDNAGKKIASLKVMLQMRGSDKIDTMAVEKPLEAQESSKDFGDMSITFNSLKKNGSNYELKLSITKDTDQGGNDWNLLQSGQLQDENGRPFRYAGGGGGGGQNGTYTYTINYASDNGGDDAAHGTPAKWTIELPTGAHAIKVPVEFKDLPLP